MSNQTFQVVLLVLIGAFMVSGDLQLGRPKCGEKRCNRDEFCSSDYFCSSCAIICDTANHNYEEKACQEKCQNYLHDQWYVRKNGDADLKAVVQKLHTLVTVTLVLICFVLVIITSYAAWQVYKWKKRKNVTLDTLWSKICSKKSDSNANNVPSATPTVNGKPSELRLEIPTPGTQSEHSPVTVTTTISSRRPAEDTVPDYAYDNPAMTSTPPNTNKGPHAHESSF